MSKFILEALLLNRRSARNAGIAFTLLVAAVAGCSSDTPPPPDVAGCSINTDCDNPNICAFKRCHKQCNDSRDCSSGQLCISQVDVETGKKVGQVCQLPDEAKCSMNSQCPGVQVCGIDGRCRDECSDSKDCVKGQVCQSHTCAEPTELTDSGGLPQVLDGGGMTRDGAALNASDDAMVTPARRRGARSGSHRRAEDRAALAARQDQEAVSAARAPMAGGGTGGGGRWLNSFGCEPRCIRHRRRGRRHDERRERRCP